MTTLDYLEKIDDTLAHWEDYFHGQEGTDVTEARANLDKVRKQLNIHSVSKPVICTNCNGDGFITAIGLSPYDCVKCNCSGKL